MNSSLLPGITQLLDNGAPLHYPVKRLDATLDAKPTSQAVAERFKTLHGRSGIYRQLSCMTRFSCDDDPLILAP